MFMVGDMHLPMSQPLHGLLGHFNHHEKCWLVIWEAGIAIEIPPGVFVFYPSSLFLHFNIDLSCKSHLDFPIANVA